MIYKEEVRDLFTVPNDYYLAHCISADLRMGKGIAVEFNRRFDMRNKLLKDNNLYSENDALLIWDCGAKGFCILKDRVFNLVTKRNYWQKPTYGTIHRALCAMNDTTKENDIKKIAMPLIGCGLDRLDWKEVSNIIRKEFDDTDIEILVCKQR